MLCKPGADGYSCRLKGSAITLIAQILWAGSFAEQLSAMRRCDARDA